MELEAGKWETGLGLGAGERELGGGAGKGMIVGAGNPGN